MAIRTKKKKKQSKKSGTSKIKTDRSILEEIIRVDHAGEYGATRIYDGQIAVFGKNSKIGKTIQHMADQEQEHIQKFEELIVKNRVRPTALIPVWNVAGYALGVSTALLGEKAAMACTVAVETVIGNHYGEQLSLLEDDQKELKKTIKKFKADELEHHDIGIAHNAEKTPGYKVLSKVIEIGCKTAIKISKKI
ncbi:demethoxyubiquinone hydroxylase family protein [Alphaproteobacteria bacterium]|nr:demethoxyubiquinone hydroxylase family protein [Alphaproteobacteria bacterium]